MSSSSIEVDFCNYSDPDDLKAVALFVNEYIEEEYGIEHVLKPLYQLRLVNGLNEHPKSVVLLAKVGGVYAGLLVGFENFSTFTAKPMINIHDVFVSPDFRGRGIGRKMIEKIESIASERSCSRVTLEVRHDNVVAQELYKSVGFADTEPPMFFWRKYLD
ncbi:MAG: GCN5-related N-acetyltransferase [Bacteroidetes bacterium]|nr:GCN5-related N-acetyltransferase [Bacteroidota bacterium]